MFCPAHFWPGLYLALLAGFVSVQYFTMELPSFPLRLVRKFGNGKAASEISTRLFTNFLAASQLVFMASPPKQNHLLEIPPAALA